MGNVYASTAGIFLIKTLFGLYILAVMLRLMLQLVRADFYNPVSQFLVKVTNPPLKPLRRIIPGLFGIDMAAVVLMAALKAVEVVFIQLFLSAPMSAAGVALLTAGQLISLLFDVFFFSILIQAVMSWINPRSYNPVVGLLHSINEPLLRPARRIIPPISGMDFSPIVVLILLQLLSILLVAPILDLGRHLMAG